jgi:hypothetical protein
MTETHLFAEVTNEVAADFAASFPLAHNGTNRQELWLDLLTEHYHDAWDPERLAMLQDHLPAIGDVALQRAVTSENSYDNQPYSEELVTQRWGMFAEHLHERPWKGFPTPAGTRWAALTAMMRNDEARIEGRAPDPHTAGYGAPSLYREFVLGDHPTGSHTFDSLLIQARSQAAVTGLPVSSGLLRRVWENQYPDVPFLPGSFAELYRSSPRASRLRHSVAFKLAGLLRR